MLRFMALVLVLFALTPAVSAEPAAPNYARAVYLDGAITGRGIDPVTNALQAYASKSKEPVDMIINSPGGEVLAGLWIIDTMKDLQSRGITIRCFVKRYAASMAFQIYLHCNERYALEGSILLWHRVRSHMQDYIAEPSGLASLLQDLLAVDAEMSRDAEGLLPLDAETISFHAEHETRHHAHGLAKLTGGNGKWMTVERAFPGLLTVPTTVPRLVAPMEMKVRAYKILYQTDLEGE